MGANMADNHFIEILTIALGEEIFGLPASVVLEILDIGPTTPVPNAPAFINKLINFRGRVAPLADLHLRCGLLPVEPSAENRIVVLEFDFEWEPTRGASKADKVYSGKQLDAGGTERVPRVGSRCRRDFVQCYGRMK